MKKMEKETKKEKEERRRKMGLNNPAKDRWARRKNQDRLIGGTYVSSALLAEAQRRRISKMKREVISRIYGRIPLWSRIWLRIKFRSKTLWRKLIKQTIQR